MQRVDERADALGREAEVDDFASRDRDGAPAARRRHAVPPSSSSIAGTICSIVAPWRCSPRSDRGWATPKATGQAPRPGVNRRSSRASALARRGAPVSLAGLARQVIEFHEAALDDAGLAVRVDGDATVAVDEPLFKRALSNLLGNAIRFAERGSTIEVRIAPDAAEQVQVVVLNAGTAIDAASLQRLFDRFFRGDASRCCDGGQQHHGLGLAIVPAIARMHAGSTLAESKGGVTKVGFTLAASPAAG